MEWLARRPGTRSPKEHVDAFEEALDALCTRAQPTLGDVTLAAIVERVLFNAAEQFPALASVRLEAGCTVSCDALRQNAEAIPELDDGVRYVLVELLTILGNVTGDILTPPLHAELSRLGSAASADDTNPGTDDEDAST